MNFFQNVFELYQNGLHIWQLGYIQLSHSSGTGPSEWWRKFVSGRQGFPWRWAKDMQKYLHLSLSAGSFACEMLAIAPVVKQMQQEEEAQRSEMAAILCGQNAHVSSAKEITFEYIWHTVHQMTARGLMWFNVNSHQTELSVGTGAKISKSAPSRPLNESKWASV